jgi:hypothetical protein
VFAEASRWVSLAEDTGCITDIEHLLAQCALCAAAREGPEEFAPHLLLAENDHGIVTRIELQA